MFVIYSIRTESLVSNKTVNRKAAVLTLECVMENTVREPPIALSPEPVRPCRLHAMRIV
jgi:hypothetical protein